jgi:signal transduction histidine kinase
MNMPVETIEALSSVLTTERLRAARRLAKEATADDEATILQALRKEDVVWVRDALQQALLRARGKSPIAPTDDSVSEVSNEVVQALYSRALNETTTLLLHEFDKLVGILDVRAAREVPHYETSRTRDAVQTITTFLDGVAKLRQATARPRLVEVDLAKIINGIADRERSSGVEIQPAGPFPFNVQADSAMLEIAIGNAIRNAVEATLSLNDNASRKPIVINWGATERDNWVAVIDEGAGLSGSVDAAFTIGATSKAGHFGMGLPAARQAMQSVDGEFTLYARANGTRAEIRWAKVDTVK